ncbi:restriction endonuclease subunit S [Salegentibacter flavus]|uniref:Type I restriction enzyme, S subunit n=1 Tax=Salegentibacter flavus TaxID=287099 RepID=A0A1I4ZU36_9FLAO|nr:restriction endonuclease subunit S [Salegentibacter flavus]SFN53698.1 type I restriction enzyme, S subunit [Salegentibacter flavus]
MEAILENELKLDKSSWQKVRFGDVVKEPKESVKDPVASGIQHVLGLEHLEPEDIHLRNYATLEESTTFTKAFKKGDVLFGRRRAYLKKAARASFSGICSGDITVFRAKENLMPELLPFIVNNEKFFDYAVKHSAGGLSPRVKFKDLAKYEFLLPPKDQQAQLAELLWVMDELKEKIKFLENKQKLFKLSFIKQEITSKEDSSNFPLKTLGELFEIKTGKMNAQDAEENGLYPFFTRAAETQRINQYTYDQEALLLPGEGHYVIKHYKGKFDVHQRTYIFTQRKNLNLNLGLYKDIIQGKVGELLQKSVGSTVNSLRKPIIEKIQVPFLQGNVQDEMFEKIDLINKNIRKSELLLKDSALFSKNLINKIF